MKRKTTMSPFPQGTGDPRSTPVFTAPVRPLPHRTRPTMKAMRNRIERVPYDIGTPVYDLENSAYDSENGAHRGGGRTAQRLPSLQLRPLHRPS